MTDDLTEQQRDRLRFLEAYKALGPGGLTITEQSELASLRTFAEGCDLEIMVEIDLSHLVEGRGW